MVLTGWPLDEVLGQALGRDAEAGCIVLVTSEDQRTTVHPAHVRYFGQFGQTAW